MNFSIQDWLPKKSFASKRSLTNSNIQRSTRTEPNKISELNSNPIGQTTSHRDAHSSMLSMDEKLIRPSISANLAEYKSHLQLSRHAPPETLSYELNYSLQDKHERIPSSQCLLGCVIYIDENECVTHMSKEDLSTWSQTIVQHGALMTNNAHQINLTHFVCAYRTSELFRQVFKRGHVRMVTAHWLNDVLERKKLFVPNLALHYPARYSSNEQDKLPLRKYSITITGFEGKSDREIALNLTQNEYESNVTRHVQTMIRCVMHEL
jgi:hypothetical protein